MTTSGHQFLSAVLGALLLNGSMAADPAAQNDQTAPDPRAIVEDMSEHLSGMQTFRVTMLLVTTMEGGGRKRVDESEFVFAVQRPDKVAQVLTRGETGMTLVCDGQKTYTYVPMLRSYTVRDAPRSLEELAGNLGSAMGDAIPVVKAFVVKDPAKALLDKVVGLSYAGIEDVGGIKCHRVRFEQEESAWDAWIAVGEKKLLMKAVPDFTKLIARVRKEQGDSAQLDLKYGMTLNLSGWVTGSELPADQFVFKPPEKTIQVDSFFPRQVGEPTPSQPGGTHSESDAKEGDSQ